MEDTQQNPMSRQYSVFKVGYQKLTSDGGWQKSKCDHRVDIQQRDGGGDVDGAITLKVTESEANRQREFIEIPNDLLRTTLLINTRCLRFTLRGVPVRKVALIFEKDQDLALVARSIDDVSPIKGMNELSGIQLTQASAAAAFSEPVPDLNDAAVQAYAARLLFDDKFHQFVMDLSAFFGELKTRLPEPVRSPPAVANAHGGGASSFATSPPVNNSNNFATPGVSRPAPRSSTVDNNVDASTPQQLPDDYRQRPSAPTKDNEAAVQKLDDARRQMELERQRMKEEKEEQAREREALRKEKEKVKRLEQQCVDKERELEEEAQQLRRSRKEQEQRKKKEKKEERPLQKDDGATKTKSVASESKSSSGKRPQHEVQGDGEKKLSRSVAEERPKKDDGASKSKSIGSKDKSSVSVSRPQQEKQHASEKSHSTSHSIVSSTPRDVTSSSLPPKKIGRPPKISKPVTDPPSVSSKESSVRSIAPASAKSVVKSASTSSTAVGKYLSRKERSDLNARLKIIWRALKNHEDSWPFLEVPRDVLAKAKEQGREPICLSAMSHRIEGTKGAAPYNSEDEMRADVMQMLKDCRDFYDLDSGEVEAADSLEPDIDTVFKCAVEPPKPPPAAEKKKRKRVKEKEADERKEDSASEDERPMLESRNAAVAVPAKGKALLTENSDEEDPRPTKKSCIDEKNASESIVDAAAVRATPSAKTAVSVVAESTSTISSGSHAFGTSSVYSSGGGSALMTGFSVRSEPSAFTPSLSFGNTVSQQAPALALDSGMSEMLASHVTTAAPKDVFEYEEESVEMIVSNSIQPAVPVVAETPTSNAAPSTFQKKPLYSAVPSSWLSGAGGL